MAKGDGTTGNYLLILPLFRSCRLYFCRFHSWSQRYDCPRHGSRLFDEIFVFTSIISSHCQAGGLNSQIKMPSNGNSTTCRVSKKKLSSPSALRRHKANKLSCSKIAKKRRAEARRLKKNARARIRYYHSLGRDVPRAQQTHQATTDTPQHGSRPVVMNFSASVI
jgi:hypothetical protein